ncbi:MAG: hydantoinase/oxoprolinase N-terminal domain-containing protein [Pseudomonadota bacterium]
MRVGVDVGGTHTDAVVIDDNQLLAAHKTLTTGDIASGVLDAVREVLTQAGVAPDAVRMMNLGTTQFTNAVVERRRLSPIAALRIGGQSSSALPIAAKWPRELREVVLADPALAGGLLVDGGTEYDGKPIVPLDEAALDDAVEQIARSGVSAVAVTSVFATTDASAEREAAARLRTRVPGIRIALSHQLGHLGLYQRENATLLNAALLPLANDVVSAFEQAFAALSMRCPFFISQNDGTLMAAAFARSYPVFTFSSGPTNSMRGALWLARHGDAMVVDVGGTTADIGMLVDGFPRPSGSAVRVGGVLTNFRMPDVLAVALGGGSQVSEDGGSVGPGSVGRDLRTRALVFGGDQLTATDIAVAQGRVQIGDPGCVAQVPAATVAAASRVMRERLEVHVDQMKTNPAPLPLVVVGGGGFLVPDGLAGVSETLRPQDGAVANAIGAALGQIGGEAQSVYVASRQPREQALAAVKAEAIARAVQAGAREGTVDVVEVGEVPLSYSDEPGGTLHARAVGDADLERVSAVSGEAAR